jgi:hypothetical protein
MRLLRINNQTADIDNETAIGVTFQGYDVTDVKIRKIKASNTFSIPLTATNRKIFENAGAAQWIGDEIGGVEYGTAIYNTITIDYFVDNIQLLNKVKIRVEEISDRIYIFVFEKNDIFDTLKNVLWGDFIADFFDWLNVPKLATPFVGTYTDFIDTYRAAEANPFLSLYFGNFYEASPPLDTEDSIKIFDWFNNDNGGHYSLHIEKIFEYIEQTYNVNFLTRYNYTNVVGATRPANIFDDPVVRRFIIPAREITSSYELPSSHFFLLSNKYDPYNNVSDKGGKTLFDVIKVFLQYFNILIDEVIINNFDVILLRRFDDLENLADVVNFSSKITKNVKFKPLSDYAQNNIIKFKNIFDGGDALLNSRNITSLNKNTDIRKEFFEIDAYIPNIYVTSDIPNSEAYIPLLAQDKTFEHITFFTYLDTQPFGKAKYDIDIVTDEIAGSGSQAETFELFVAQIYDLNSEYLLLERALQYPKFYEIEKWLTINDIHNLEFFKLYYIKQLNGCFFLNRITNFNPQKSKQPTIVELFRISDRTPITPPEAEDYYTDGILDGFTDGLYDLFY